MQSCCYHICSYVLCFTYKVIIDMRKKIGRSRTTWPYFDAMEELLGQDPAVHPPVIVSAGVCGYWLLALSGFF